MQIRSYTHHLALEFPFGHIGKKGKFAGKSFLFWHNFQKFEFLMSIGGTPMDIHAPFKIPCAQNLAKIGAKSV